MQTMTFVGLNKFAEKAGLYSSLRKENPAVSAQDIKNYVDYRGDGGWEPLHQFMCSHDWAINEETDRCYCLNCGADGDA